MKLWFLQIWRREGGGVKNPVTRVQMKGPNFTGHTGDIKNDNFQHSEYKASSVSRIYFNKAR